MHADRLFIMYDFAKCVVGVKEKHYCKSKKVNPGYSPYPLFYSTHGNRVCTPWCDLLCDWRCRDSMSYTQTDHILHIENNFFCFLLFVPAIMRSMHFIY